MQRQLAQKILIIFFIGLILLIPITMVKSKVYERKNTLNQAQTSISQSWTGSQLISSPIVVVPYQALITTHEPKTVSAHILEGKTTKTREIKSVRKTRYKIITPDNFSGKVAAENSAISKGIYEVPIYSSDISFTGFFSTNRISESLEKIRNSTDFLRFGTPYLSFHVSDMRGIDKAPSLSINSKSFALSPGSNITSFPGGLHHIFDSIDLNKIMDTNRKEKQTSKGVKPISFSIDFSLRGMKGFHFIQLADSANLSMQSNWPHPEFTGSSLPKHREISDKGFNAQWSSTRFSNNNASAIEKCLHSPKCNALAGMAAGVNFIDPVDVYLQSERSLKYALLFIGLSFIAFFIFENIKRVPIHPIQYTFVGLAISVFYLLLISLSEHLAFYLAYLIAATACVSLLFFYVRYIFNNMRSALLFTMMISLLYALLFVIVQAEDFALLMGSALVFVVLATLMIVTRKINWYQLTPSNAAFGADHGQRP